MHAKVCAVVVAAGAFVVAGCAGSTTDAKPNPCKAAKKAVELHTGRASEISKSNTTDDAWTPEERREWIKEMRLSARIILGERECFDVEWRAFAQEILAKYPARESG